MAADGWRSGRNLSQQIRDEYRHFNPYQLVRLLLREHRDADRGSRLMDDEALLDRAVRFRADLSRSFPGNEISALRPVPPGQKGPIVLRTPNYGIAAAQGPLPDTYTELCERRESGAMVDFLDLFNHRFNALRYQIKSRHHPGLTTQHPEESEYAFDLSAIMGLTGDMARRLPLPLRTLLSMAGLWAGPRKTLPAIETVLSLFLKCRVTLRQLQGMWRDVSADEHSHLGRESARLGQTAALGTRVWDQQGMIELVVGPIDYAKSQAIIPGGRGHDAFVSLVRYATGRRFDCRVRFIIQREQLPTTRLYSRGPGSRLSTSSWLVLPGRGRGEGDDRQLDFVIKACEADGGGEA